MELASPVDSIGTHQATPSCATFEEVIALCTSRVLARFAPGSVQPAATAGPGELAWALLAVPGAACLPEQLATLVVLPLLVLQPAAARPAATTMAAVVTALRLTKHPIPTHLLRH